MLKFEFTLKSGVVKTFFAEPAADTDPAEAISLFLGDLRSFETLRIADAKTGAEHYIVITEIAYATGEVVPG